MDLRVVGVDACPAGWVGVGACAPSGEVELSGYVAGTIEDLVRSACAPGPVDVIAVDMPVGLGDASTRAPDVLAKKLVHRRHSSVFMTPPRSAFQAGSRALADEVSRQLVGKGVSAQALALGEKLIEVDEWVQRTQHRVVEVHPEVSFAVLADRGLASKKTWAGMRDRLDLLRDAGLYSPSTLIPEDAKVAIDDVLDACVPAWTGLRLARGEARSFPDPPVVYSDGWPCAIWA